MCAYIYIISYACMYIYICRHTCHMHVYTYIHHVYIYTQCVYILYIHTYIMYIYIYTMCIYIYTWYIIYILYICMYIYICILCIHMHTYIICADCTSIPSHSVLETSTQAMTSKKKLTPSHGVTRMVRNTAVSTPTRKSTPSASLTAAMKTKTTKRDRRKYKTWDFMENCDDLRDIEFIGFVCFFFRASMGFVWFSKDNYGILGFFWIRFRDGSLDLSICGDLMMICGDSNGSMKFGSHRMLAHPQIWLPNSNNFMHSSPDERKHWPQWLWLELPRFRVLDSGWQAITDGLGFWGFEVVLENQEALALRSALDPVKGPQRIYLCH